MFERYLSDALARNFGDIIQNHTCSQQMSISAGRLVLHDVELQPTALQHVLGNPSTLEIRYGKIGQLDLQIPWRVLRGFLLGLRPSVDAALAVSVRDVHIWLAPPSQQPEDTTVSQSEDDEATAAANETETDLLREQTLQSTLESRVMSPNKNAAASWKRRLVESLMARLSVTVHNIHVRYEDASGVAFGLTLAELVAQQRAATIERCAIYWRDAYLLEPLSATVDWNDILNVKTVLPVCRLAVSRSLLQDIGCLRKQSTAWFRKDVKKEEDDTFLERPIVPATEDPRAWWRYAISAVSLPRSRIGWKSLILALRQRKQYLSLFEAFVRSDTLADRRFFHTELLVLERNLSVEEVVSFRLWVYAQLCNEKVKTLPTTQSKREKDDHSESEVEGLSSLLSPENRVQSFMEIAEVLQRKDKLDPQVEVKPNKNNRQLSWRASLQCNELSLQVSDSHISLDGTILSVPILRMSCAIDYQQEIFTDGSWNLVNRIGSLLVKDCTGSTKWFRDGSPEFDAVGVNLVGPKGGDAWKDKPDEIFYLDGEPFHQSAWFQIQRTKQWSHAGDFDGSTTITKARVLPLELLYSPAPMESASHVIATASAELVDDYENLSNTVSTWRRNQQKRLLRALAHNKKKLLADIVVGAPVLLFPEGSYADSPMVVVNLGELRFSDDSKHNVPKNAFDDRWRVSARSIAVERSTPRLYCYPDHDLDEDEDEDQHVFDRIVEPFSLNVSIWTKVEEDETMSSDRTSVLVHATLPRLYVNLTTSTVQLFYRLQNQWQKLKQERKGRSASRESLTKPDGNGGERKIQFNFEAPLLGGRLADDESGPSNSPPSLKQIFDIELKGITGKIDKNTTPEVESTTFSLNVHTLSLHDTYQGAGPDFSLLVSSVPPEFLSPSRSFDSPRPADQHLHGSDLVSVEYQNRRELVDLVSVPEEHEPSGIHTLLINFNELFVNWNPETIAAIARSISSKPLEAEPPLFDDSFQDSITTLDEEFFDAPEDAFFDAVGDECSGLDHEFSGNSSFRAILSVFSARPSTKDAEYPDEKSLLNDFMFETKPLQIVFSLVKLKINFNREVRHRRLITTEMDNTTIRFKAMSNGGSRTYFKMGNLSLSDCSSGSHKTLYREILGLKTDSRMGIESKSLLEMEMIVNPRSRRYKSLGGKRDDPLAQIGVPVSIDLSDGVIHGFDTYFSARFSPMRFVFLEQLWFEIVDYFFCGVIGNEVFGGKTPSPSDASRILEGKCVDAEKISFTRFNVTMDAPVILLPVSPCSTDFLRIVCSSVHLENYFRYDELRPANLSFTEDGESRQCFNNCQVELSMMEFHNWSGQSLSTDNPTAQLHLNWPVGPSSVANVPKWKVDCSIDKFNTALQPKDFALFQHIVTHNIGELSRYTDEWKALRALLPGERSRFFSSVFVPFGYDDKEATPSTYSVSVEVSSTSFALRDESNAVSVVMCKDLVWTYNKLSDRISVQRLMCTPTVSDPVDGNTVLSFQPKDATAYGLAYVSTTQHSGSNHKTLTLSGPVFSVQATASYRMLTFFGEIPSPSFLSPEEAIQVGDRWYRIGEPNAGGSGPECSYAWLSGYETTGASVIGPSVEDVSYGFQLTIISPKLQTGRDMKLCLVADQLDYDHKSLHGTIERAVEVANIKSLLARPTSNSNLVAPFNVAAVHKGCNGVKCRCVSHQTHVSCEVQVAFLVAHT